MLARTRIVFFKARAACDVSKNGHTVRLKVLPNPVSSYTKLPASLRTSLSLVDPEKEEQEKEKKRALIGELLRSGSADKQRAASVIVDRLRTEQAGRSAHLHGPVEITIVAKDGAVRKMETFVCFGTEKEEQSPLGKTAQLGLRDLEHLGVRFDWGSWDLTFGEMVGTRKETGDVPERVKDDAAAAADDASAQTDARHERMSDSSRKLAASILPGRTHYTIPPPEVDPKGPLAYEA